MKIEIEAEQKHPETTMTPMTFTAIGTAAWVRIDVAGMTFEVDASEFQRVAAAIWNGD